MLDLSSGDNRENPQGGGAGGGGAASEQEQQQLFGQQQQQQGQSSGFIPQIVMNPWDPNQTPVMTLAPLANAMQAYHQQMLSNIQQQQQQQPSSQQAAAAAATPAAASVLAMAAAASGQAQQQQQQQEEEEEQQRNKCKVLCVAPDEEMGFLMNLPPPCNVMLQPSTIGMSGKVPQSKFLDAYERFLKGEVPPQEQPKPQPSASSSRPQQPSPSTGGGGNLPGKKAYVPPYTPKNAGGRSSSGGGGGGGGSRSGPNKRSSSSASKGAVAAAGQPLHNATASPTASTSFSAPSGTATYGALTITPASSSASKAKKQKIMTDEERLEEDRKSIKTSLE